MKDYDLIDRKEFNVNDYMKLRLENDETVIYVNNIRFLVCKYLLISFPTQQADEFENINSIDEAAEKLDNGLHPRRNGNDFQRSDKIPPETEFWGHCSNLQVWNDNNYDTRLLHTNLAFPLLKKLSEVGDPLARGIFQEEICKRFESFYPTTMKYLLIGGYLQFLTKEQKSSLLEEWITRDIENVFLFLIEIEFLSEFGEQYRPIIMKQFNKHITKRFMTKIQKDLFSNQFITEIEIQHNIISNLRVSRDFLDVLKDSKISKIIDNLEVKNNYALYPSLVRFFFLMKDLKGFYTVDARMYFIKEDLVDWFRFFQNKFDDLLEYILMGYFSQEESSLFQRITDFLEALIVMAETLPLVAEELLYDSKYEISRAWYISHRWKAISLFSLLYEANWLYYDLFVSGLPTDCRELQKRYHFPLNKKKVKENKVEFAQFIKKYSITEEINKKKWEHLQKKVYFYDL